MVLLGELKTAYSNLCNLTDKKPSETLLHGSFLFNINQNRSSFHSALSIL